MQSNTESGQIGENTASIFLESKGYKVKHRNWRFRQKEIDIVAETEKLIVFVEVKTRSSLLFEHPKEAVTKNKQKNIIDAADAWWSIYNPDKDSRFDIVSVLLSDNGAKVIDHLEDAFTARDF